MEKNLIISNTKIIAEIANSHQGEADQAIELANKCIDAGADAVKFQVYSAEELLHINHQRFQHFKKQSFNFNEWKRIFKKIKKKNSKIYCDVFGLQSLAIAQNKKVDGFKVHSSDLINKNLLDKLCKVKKKDIFLSTGGSTLREISYAVKIFKKNKIIPILMHGYQSYPTKITDINLNRINLLKDIFKDNCFYGLQDHIAGDDEMSSVIPLVSLSLNVSFIEKHVTLNRAKKGVDYFSSIEPQNLKKLISQINQVKSSFGVNQFNFSKSEKKYRDEVKKIWYLNKNLNKNEKLSNKNLIMLRPPSPNIAPALIEKFEKLRLNTSYKKNTPVSHSFSDQKKVGAIIVSRLKSKRLPNKALKLINQETLITHLIKRLKLAKNIDKIVLATTKNNEDLKICNQAKKNKINFFRGDEKNVLKRMYDAAKKFKCNIVIRVTGDDILIDPNYLDKLIKYHIDSNLEYSNNKDLPGGTEVEIFDFDILKFLLNTIVDVDNTEYLTFFIQEHLDQFITGSLKVSKKHKSNKSLTIDTYEDYMFVKKFLKDMKKKKLKYNYSLDHIMKFLDKNIKKKRKTKKIVKVNTELKWEKILN